MASLMPGNRRKGFAVKKKIKHRLDSTSSKVYNPTVDFGKIKELRLKLGINQTEAAKRAGWETQQQWANFENGKRPDPRLSSIVRVCRVLGCKVIDLLKE
jgi:DNA-binding XRE family transcriptional regulator